MQTVGLVVKKAKKASGQGKKKAAPKGGGKND